MRISKIIKRNSRNDRISKLNVVTFTSRRDHKQATAGITITEYQMSFERHFPSINRLLRTFTTAMIFFLHVLTCPKCYWTLGPIWFDTFLCAHTVRPFLELWQFAPTATTKKQTRFWDLPSQNVIELRVQFYLELVYVFIQFFCSKNFGNPHQLWKRTLDAPH